MHGSTLSENDVFNGSNAPSNQSKSKTWAISLPNTAFTEFCAGKQDAEQQFNEAKKIYRTIRTQIPSTLYRCLSDTAIHLESSSGYPTPPYSNFARYLPCLSTPTDDTTKSSISHYSVCDSEESSESEFRLPISASQLSLPEPPDGGWGWVVVFAAFLVHTITEGVVVSFGIFIEDLAQDFQQTMSATSWVGSFSYGVPALATPISSLILDRFGCRATCMLGALISCVGCLIGSFANSLSALVFTFGILTGFGFSLCMTAALVVVSVYFDELRATATGLSIAGTGVGALVFAPAVEFLITVYTWRGTFMILAGAVLNMAVCGALMRPVETRTERRHRQRLAWLEHFAKESGLPSLSKSADYLDKDVLGRIKILRDRLLAPRKCSGRAHAVIRMPEEYFRNRREIIPVSIDNKNKGSHTFTDANKQNVSKITPVSSGMDNAISNGSVTPSRGPYINRSPLPVIHEYECLSVEQLGTNQSTFSDNTLANFEQTKLSATQTRAPISYFASALDISVCAEHKAVRRCHSFSRIYDLAKMKNQSQGDVTGGFTTDPCIIQCPRSNRTIENGKIPQFVIFTETSGNQTICKSTINDIVPSPRIESSNSSIELIYKVSLVKAFGITRGSLCKALSLPDMGKVHRIRRRSGSEGSRTSTVSLNSSVRTCVDKSCCIWLSREEESDEDDESSGDGFKCCGTILTNVKPRYLFRRLFDFRLFRRFSFNMFILSNILLYFWYNVTYFFMGVHAVNLGLSETQAALLFSVLGGANMIGEIFVGLLADRDWVDALTLYFFMVTMCGISTALVPYMTSFTALSFYTAIFGVGMSANDALCTVLLVEFVGLDHLTSALGICFFCQGVANILGPPFIGFIIDSAHSQGPAYNISGVGLTLSGLVVIPIIVYRFRRRRARRLRRKQAEASRKTSVTQNKDTDGHS